MNQFLCFSIYWAVPFKHFYLAGTGWQKPPLPKPLLNHKTIFLMGQYPNKTIAQKQKNIRFFSFEKNCFRRGDNLGMSSKLI